MSERAFWHKLRAELAPYGRLVRIESTTEPGIWDVNYCLLGVSGWMELKYLASWPVRATHLRIPSLTPAQAVFGYQWARHGGTCWLALQVGRWYGLLPPELVVRVERREATVTEVQQVGWEGWNTAKFVQRMRKRLDPGDGEA